MQQQIERTEGLLEELHETFRTAMTAIIVEAMKSPSSEVNPFKRGDVLREAIFYAGESAYNFQYRDLAPQKYTADDIWLQTNKSFPINAARDVVRALENIQSQKIASTLAQMVELPPSQWTILGGFTFGLNEVVTTSGLATPTVESVLDSFTVPAGERNEQFCALSDFNVANATPLLKLNGDFVSFQSYSLAAALYESPFYWMAADKNYAPIAAQNRGSFTEAFCRERLELVFGNDRVHSNVDIFESKAKKIGEIDVLVLFGDRAIVVQAKSKRLTLEARKGNDGQLRDDFKKSVQDAYDQGLSCARRLTEQNVTFAGPDGREIKAPYRIREIYILCVVSDHYPSLNFQVRQFLDFKTTKAIQPPLVLDIFALDAMSEMLSTPLRFLSYLNRRVQYARRLLASHELIILSYHLKHNLWLENDVGLLQLTDDLSADLDVAMSVRRNGLRGRSTPEGLLTRLTSTSLGRIVAEIESRPEPGVIDFGFLLLALSEKGAQDVSQGIQKIRQRTARDRKAHDLTLTLDSASSGITIHCTEGPMSVAGPDLQNHCERRKYIHKAKTWFGVCVHPSDESLRFGLKLDYEWEPNARLEEMTRDMSRSGDFVPPAESSGKAGRVGRNDPCPCNSGLKYKKCHGK